MESKIPINFFGLRDNIEKLFLKDFTKPLITGCSIDYRFDNIHISMFPSAIIKFGFNSICYGEIDFIIQNSPNKMVEKVIRLIFEELNSKYKNVEITDEELCKTIIDNGYIGWDALRCLVKDSPQA